MKVLELKSEILAKYSEDPNLQKYKEKKMNTKLRLNTNKTNLTNVWTNTLYFYI